MLDALPADVLSSLVDELGRVRGVVAVVLGGSRARGTHRPDSDIDLGLYYRGELDIAALQALASRASDAPVEVTAPGGWGPWVDGGGWLTIDGQRVDWIYRDLDRVHRVWATCQAGDYQVVPQAGHPLGYYTHTYAGEVAICRILADATGELAALQAAIRSYPRALGDALLRGLWEADFMTQVARYGAAGDDPTYAAGCLFRVVGVLCHALHGHAGQWLINEKAMVAATARLANAPRDFAARIHGALGALGTTRASIDRCVDEVAAVVAEVRARVA